MNHQDCQLRLDHTVPGQGMYLHYMIHFCFHQDEDTVTNCVGALVVLGYCSSITRLRLHKIQIEFSLELVKTWCSIITY